MKNVTKHKPIIRLDPVKDMLQEDQRYTICVSNFHNFDQREQQLIHIVANSVGPMLNTVDAQQYLVDKTQLITILNQLLELLCREHKMSQLVEWIIQSHTVVAQVVEPVVDVPEVVRAEQELPSLAE